MNIGVIGAGLMGTTHIRVLSAAVSGARVAAVSDAFPQAAERAAAENGIATIHADAYELIRDPDVEAVIIASPAPTHEQFTLACLDAGKPVLCEKPLATNAEASLHVGEAEAALRRRLRRLRVMPPLPPRHRALQPPLPAG